MCAKLYFYFSSPTISESMHPFLHFFIFLFPSILHFPPVKLQAKVSKRLTWLRLMASQQTPAGLGYLSHTKYINIGFDLTLLENNQFDVIQSEGTSNANLARMKPHELANLVGVSARSCELLH